MIAGALFGWGTLLARLLRIDFPSAAGYWQRLWLGFAAIILILQIWNLAWAIDFRATVLVYGGGHAIFFIQVCKSPRRCLVWFEKKRHCIYLFILLVAACWIASRAMLAPDNFDSGLYHFNSIRWLNEYPIVPGLGNLHGRLAFNQSFFAFVASLNLYPFSGHGHNFANSMLLLMLFSEALYFLVIRLRRIAPGESAGGVVEILPILFIPFLLYTAFRTSLSSPSPDTASLVLQIVLFLNFFRLVESRIQRDPVLSLTKVILILATAMVTIKLSNLCFAGLISIISFSMGYRKSPGMGSWLIKNMVVTVAFAALMLTVWMGRGVVLSGYPCYPATFMGFHTDWAVPQAKAQAEANWISSWARQPETDWRQVLGNWNWFQPWLRRIMNRQLDVVYPLALSLFFMFLFGVRVIRSAIRHRRVSAFWIISFVPIAAGLVFWFVLAPHPRFAHALFWITPIALAAMLLAGIESRRARKAMSAFISILFVGPFLFWFYSNLHEWKRVSLAGWMPTPHVEMTEKVTLSGLKLFVPREGKQSWDSPLPTTPNFNPQLCLRGSGLAAGFLIRPRAKVLPPSNSVVHRVDKRSKQFP